MDTLRITISSTLLPVNRSLANAYAAMAPITRLNNVELVATIKLFNIYLAKGCSVNTFR